MSTFAVRLETRCIGHVHCRRANNPRIVRMVTVGAPPSVVSALIERVLSSCTLQVVQPDGSRPFPEGIGTKKLLHAEEAQLSADDFGIVHVPPVRTDGAPLSVVRYLYPALAIRTAFPGESNNVVLC